MDSNIKPIASVNQLIKVRGKVFYNDHRRRIDIKKPVRDLFDCNSGNVFYVMELAFIPEVASKRIKELFSKGVVPVIIYFLEEEVVENA